MRGSSKRVSRTHSIVCPACELGELRICGPEQSRCGSCSRVVDGGILEVLRQIVALPEAIGTHACECGHPQMRRLPDGVFHCPACGSEVLPAGSSLTLGKSSGAYRAGWIDGRYGETGSVAHNTRIVGWQEERDRLDYYRGHRGGRKASGG